MHPFLASCIGSNLARIARLQSRCDSSGPPRSVKNLNPKLRVHGMSKTVLGLIMVQLTGGDFFFGLGCLGSQVGVASSFQL